MLHQPGPEPQPQPDSGELGSPLHLAPGQEKCEQSRRVHQAHSEGAVTLQDPREPESRLHVFFSVR